MTRRRGRQGDAGFYLPVSLLPSPRPAYRGVTHLGRTVTAWTVEFRRGSGQPHAPTSIRVSSYQSEPPAVARGPQIDRLYIVDRIKERSPNHPVNSVNSLNPVNRGAPPVLTRPAFPAAVF